MSTKKTEPKTDKQEREYVIPLREKCRVVPRYKKTNKAIKTIKEFLVKHMKIYDRDLNKIKIDEYVNEVVWARGIRKPPAKIKVKAFKEGDLVRVELVEIPEKLRYRKVRIEKQEKKASTAGQKKKSLMQKAKEPKVETKTEEEKVEEKEKAKAGAEATKKLEKQAKKQIKHQSGGKTKQKTQPQRKALAK